MPDKAPFESGKLKKLKEYNVPYAEGAWENFETFRNNKKDRKRTILFFYRVAAVIVLIFSAGLGLYKLIDPKIHSTSINQFESPEKKEISKPKKNKSENKIVNKIDESGSHIKADKFGQEQMAYLLKINVENIDRPEDSKIVIIKPNILIRSLASLPAQNLAVYLQKPIIFFKPKDQIDKTPEQRSFNGYSIALDQHANRSAKALSGYSFAFGGSTEIPLNKKMELSAGLSIGKHSFAVEKGKIESFSTNGIAHLDQVNYRWTNIEIPLNIHYQLLQTGKIDIKLQGGVSMVGAVGQISDYKYSNRRLVTTVSNNGGPVQVLTKVIDDTEIVRHNEDKNRLSLGAMAHLSVGLNYPLSKRALALEPFIEYPIGTLTADKLQFFSAGIQLRWRLRSAKIAE